MSRGFPFGYFVFSSVLYNQFIEHCQNMAYDVKSVDCIIYFYDSKEFYEIIDFCCECLEIDVYVIDQINSSGAKYRKL